LRNANRAAAVTDSDPVENRTTTPGRASAHPGVVAGTKLWGQLTPRAESPARLVRGDPASTTDPTEAGSYPSGIS